MMHLRTRTRLTHAPVAAASAVRTAGGLSARGIADDGQEETTIRHLIAAEILTTAVVGVAVHDGPVAPERRFSQWHAIGTPETP